MRRLANKFLAHIDIAIMMLTSLFMGGMAWAHVSMQLDDHEAKLLALTQWQMHQQETVNSIQQSSARTEQKVDDIAINIANLQQWMQHK